MVETRQELLARLDDARAKTDELFELVRPEALFDRPIPARHRIIFYLGHLEAFDWNLIGRYVLDLDSFHKDFDRLFAFGIDPVGGGLPMDQAADWPCASEVRRYNGRVRETLDAWLERASFSAPNRQLLEDGVALHVAIEHRLMHAETLAYMLHQLPPGRKLPQPILPAPTALPVEARMVEIPAGAATLGRPRAANGAFGWDNEFEAHVVTVPTFAIDVYNVANGQYLEFLRAGGYQDRALWAEDDWDRVTREGPSHPILWAQRGDRWFYRTMFAEIPLPLDWPVFVSHAEAAAYTRWVKKALPTEAQFHRAAYGTPEGQEREYPWGNTPPEPRFGNFDAARWNLTPVGAYSAGRSAFGVADLVGNGWEWTSSQFDPFPGFEPFPFYRGYSADFFDGKHYVLKGASPRTAACMLRRSFRNWFQPHYPYVYAAFRCVEN